MHSVLAIFAHIVTLASLMVLNTTGTVSNLPPEANMIVLSAAKNCLMAILLILIRTLSMPAFLAIINTGIRTRYIALEVYQCFVIGIVAINAVLLESKIKIITLPITPLAQGN